MPDEDLVPEPVVNGSLEDTNPRPFEAFSKFRADPTAKTPSAFVEQDEVLEVTSEVLRHLQAIALRCGETSRLCFHKANESQSNFMLIAYAKDVESRVKRHLTRNKTYVFVRGALDLEIYSEDGRRKVIHRLSPQETTILFVPAGTFHRTHALSDDTLVVEYLDGAFVGEEEDREYLA